MVRAIFDVSIYIAITLGMFAVGYVVYNGLHDAIYDPSVPHDFLWHTFFGR